jgi:chromosome partitioning protein
MFPPATAGALALAERPIPRMTAPHLTAVTAAEPARPPAAGRDPLLLMIAGLKGGIGKSTSAWLICTELARRGWCVLGVDADPVSQTLADSYRQAFARGYTVPFTIISWPTADGFSAGVTAAARGANANAIIVDVGGESPDMFDAAGMYCPELVVPIAPTEYDLRRLPATQQAAMRVAQLKPLSFSVLLVKTKSRAADARLAREYLEGEDWPLMEAQVPDSVLYQRSFGHVLDDTGAYQTVVDELLAAHAEAEAGA